MVAAVHYYADSDDTADLLTYLGEGRNVELRSWFPYDERSSGTLVRDHAIASRQVAIVSSEFGEPALIRNLADIAPGTSARARVFARMNLERRSDPAAAIVDSNRSPVLYWEPALVQSGALLPGSIGSQADSMRDISVEYERWVNRVTGWLKRRGSPVWGLRRSKVRPDLKIESPYLNTLYALPGALKRLEAGDIGR